MLLTLGGRIQNRLFVVLVIGTIWTLILTPFLGSMGEGYVDTFFNAFQVLCWVAFLGIFWEFLWHGLQQFRWEKDWPIMYALFQFIPEGILVYFIVNPSFLGLTTGGGVPTGAFLLHFITTVLVTWLWSVSFVRVFFIKHRYSGGRYV